MTGGGPSFSQRQLGWVSANRRQPSRTLSIHAAAASVLTRLPRSQAADIDEIVEAVYGVVDDEFRAHCRQMTVSRGVLKIVVSDRRLVYSYRLRWAMDLLETVRKICPGRRVRSVVFSGN